MKHTSGPWEIVRGANFLKIEGICSLSGVDQFYRFDLRKPADQEQMANARLIAAAPELLEALKLVSEELSSKLGPEDNWSAVNVAKFMIAKATDGAK